ncbi:hypothetical protein PG995_007634 [Apiospora arundinis]
MGRETDAVSANKFAVLGEGSAVGVQDEHEEHHEQDQAERDPDEQDPNSDAANILNSTGGKGYQQGCNYFPAQHTKIHVIKSREPQVLYITARTDKQDQGEQAKDK